MEVEFQHLVHNFFDLSAICLLKMKAAAFPVVAGLRFCPVAHGLPDSGGLAEPTEETAD